MPCHPDRVRRHYREEPVAEESLVGMIWELEDGTFQVWDGRRERGKVCPDHQAAVDWLMGTDG